MPYIPQPARDQLNSSLPQVGEWLPSNAGELTYVITRTIVDYLVNDGAPVRFQKFSDVAGALHYAQTELDRRMQFPYEDRKRQENGDVYPAA